MSPCSMEQAKQVPVTQAEAGQKLINFLRRRLKAGVPHSALMRWIRTGQVRVDGHRAKPFLRLAENMIVRIPPHEPGASEPEAGGATSPALAIVFEDQDLLVIAKPQGLPVHGGSRHTISLHSLLAARHPAATFAPTPAHRLDKDTSGLVLVALSYACLAKLHELMRQRRVAKTYLAWVHGRLPLSRVLLLKDELEKTGAPGRERVTVGGGKESLAEALALRHQGQTSLVAIRLITGRTHQIRVQLAARGHAILGDRKYGQGRNAAQEPGCLLLHAWRIALPGTSYALAPDWPEPYAVDRESAGPDPFGQDFSTPDN